MIAKLIAFLQWIESSEKPKKWFDFLFSFAFTLMSVSAVHMILKETIFWRSYSYMYGYPLPSNIFTFDERITADLFIFSFTILFLFAIIGSYIYGIYKKITTKDFSIVRIIMNSVLPLTTGVCLIALHTTELSMMRWYIYLFGGLYALSPFILFIEGFARKSLPILSRFFEVYKKYIIAFLIWLTIFFPLFFLGEIFDELRHSRLGEIIIVSFFSLCGYGLGIWFILTYAWMELDEVSETSWRNILRGGVALAFIFLIIWLSPNWKTLLVENRIQKAQSILQKEGEWKVWLQKAADTSLLKWALIEQYQSRKWYGSAELYAKIFDASIESVIDDEVDADKFKARNSNATTQIARGENAKVTLNFAKHDTEILRDIGAVETTVTYEFQNTDIENQEVIYSIELPNTESAMTDLRLGLNLELTGTLAPRGAALQVYEDSLRRNIDPALLEQTGPTTYRLRVFPVLSKNDTKTQWRQRVQFKYVSPLHMSERITLMPKTDILNLKLTDNSEIMTRVTEWTKVLMQESEKTDDIETLNAGKRAKLDTNMSKDVGSFCSVNTYPNIDMSKFGTLEKKLTKNIVFLDISKSAWEDKKIKVRYQELINAWKNNGVALDIYTFNTAITSAGYDISDVDFWGTTDMASVIAYITENALESANIVILTDDSSYELVLAENKSIDYKRLKSNRISLIQIGTKIRTLKTEVTKSILASEWEVMSLSNDGSIEEWMKTLFAPKKTREKCESYFGSSLPVLGALQGNREGKMLMGEDISNEELLRVIHSESIFSWWLRNSTIQQLLQSSPLKNESPLLNDTTKDSETIIIRNIVWLPILVLDNEKTLLFNNEEDLVKYKINRLKKYVGRVIYIIDFAPFSQTDNEILSSFSVNVNYQIFWWNPLPLTSHWKVFVEKVTNSAIQHNISQTAHIVNQSMSLIALETEEQRRDLERYSEQEDKYDTKYENFTSESPSPIFDRRQMMDDRMMGPQSMSIWTSKSSQTFNNAGYTDGLKLWSSSSSNALSFGSSSSSENTSMLQYIIVIILFPLIAWFVLRRQPKTKQEAQKEEPKK